MRKQEGIDIMDYRFLLQESNENMKEQHALSIGRIREMVRGTEIDDSSMPESVKNYFKAVAHFLLTCADLYHAIEMEGFFKSSFEKLAAENHLYYEDILPANYETSYANPAYAVEVLGEEYGRIFSFLYTELRSIREYVFEQNLEKVEMLIELFLEVYFLFEHEEVTYKQLKETVHSYMYDYAEEWISWQVRQQLDPELNYVTSLVMEADLTDPKYLYYYGDYISVNEINVSKFLARQPEELIQEMAETYVESFRQGFLNKGVDFTKKKLVCLQYPIGFERVVRVAIEKFAAYDIRPVIYPSFKNSMNKVLNKRAGYTTTNPNVEFDYDHRFDDAIYFDKRMVDRKISCLRHAYETYAEEASVYAGPATILLFGQPAYVPKRKTEAYHLSERQQNLKVEYAALSNQLMNEFIPGETRSFSLISYPAPTIGEPYEEIFHAIHRVNTIDREPYKVIQQCMIDILDKAKYVKIMGRKRNMTNITIQLHDLKNTAKETNFHSSLSDVNVPLGEVFTSPKLKKTEGLLHVTDVCINGMHFKELRLQFEDGMVTDYSCGNFKDPEEGRRYVKENILMNHDTLPIGEFAIGTNTLAYVLATKYDIIDKLPVLITEKMGPHVAVGDTCYAYGEEEVFHNPDGKEIVAKENECSAQRHENPKKAYFNCHIDIPLPYEEIGRIVAVTEDRIEIPLIYEGRFVHEGILALNDPFMGQM